MKFQIQEKMEISFKNILKNHTCEELDIENKKISINSKNIERFKTELGYNEFKTSIFNELGKEIGYFSLVFTNENEEIDEYFVIN
jgi:nicotinamide mononucleotide adenylyltransferase